MTIRVDFVQGLDSRAPGLFRAQEPLIAALERSQGVSVHRIRFAARNPRLLLLSAYGPIPARLWLSRASLVHIGNGNYGHLVPVLRKPAIVTCHDLIELEMLERNNSMFRAHRRFHVHAAFSGMLRARFIVCVSTSTAQQVLRRAPHVSDRIRVIPSGLDSVFSPGPVNEHALSRLGVRRPYVLYVGSEQERKNLPRLVSAISRARRAVPDLQFVKVGDHQTLEGRGQLLHSLASNAMERDTRILDKVEDEELIELYRGAALTALPSLQEGFGFPALESMACGCPALISRDPALIETTGGQAVSVEAEDEISMASTIVQLIQDTSSRQIWIERGLERAREFSWMQAAKSYAALYREAIATR